MYLNNLQVYEHQVRQSLLAERLPAHARQADAQLDWGRKVRQGIGEAFIALGYWIKPRTNNNRVASAWGGR